MSVDVESRNSGTGKIITISYDRQSKLNSLNTDGIKELTSVFKDISNDPAMRTLVITGAGSRAFIGGADINELNEMTTETSRNFISSLHELFLLIRELPVPTVAKVNGYSLGAGMELAAACDLRIASDTAIFGMPEVRVGVPSVIEAALLPRLIGWGRTNYLVLTGTNIDSKTAYEWGFLEQVFRPKELDSEVEKITDTIAECGPIAVRAQKELVSTWEKVPLEQGIQAGIDAFSEAFKTDEPQRMMQSFFKRKSS